jgi:L-alanine-DL-glutamate epimerase-like enolase superfamily enzyme
VRSLVGTLRIESVDATALSVPLREPFVIASGRVDATRAAEIRVRVEWNGWEHEGLGEAGCLPPVTWEDQDDALDAVARARPALVGARLEANEGAIRAALLDAVPGSPVARAGVECALLDALARGASMPLRALLDAERGARTTALETDITVPIGPPAAMAERAKEWASRGFRALKIKVGKDVDSDARALEAIGRAAPFATLRVDANGGYSADEAIALASACERLGLAVEVWEQPCATGDWDAMGRVSAAVRAPVVADESVRTLEDVETIVRLGCARGINLKLAKFAGPLAAHAAGIAAQRAGLAVMVGGMVETRLGMTSAAHVVCALGGVDFVDLDTAWLLADDPYEGGYAADGPRYTMPDAHGIGVTRPRVL